MAEENQAKAGDDEAAIFARFVSAPEDAAAFLAYALHRKALLAFRAEFRARQNRAPDAAEEAAFLIGETSEARLAAYHAEATAMIGAKQLPPSSPTPPPSPPRSAPAKRKRKLPWFGYWVESPLAPEKPEAINWRGLVVRLFVLLLAVVTTAILLRVLFVAA